MTGALVPARPSPHARALVERYGRDTVNPQGLSPALHHWFDGERFVAFVDTGGAWVAAGSPCAPIGELAAVARRFTEAAREHGRRACFFAAERPLVDAGLRALAIGEQPVWDAWRWPEVLAGASSLRYQVRRAIRHDVRVRPLARDRPDEVAALRALIARWQAAHAMPPMRFLVDLDLRVVADARRTFVAVQGERVVGFAALLAVPARDRVFVEHLVRAPDAPNGTVELLVDAAMREAGARTLTLGLAPLAGDVARWLRVARWLGAPLYDFAGLHAFKAKLRPHAWEPVYLCTTGGALVVALRDSLRAFAGGSLLAFAGRTLTMQR